MRNKFKIILSTVLLLVCSPAMAKFYYMTGPNYTEVYGPYTTSMRVTGFIETSAPLPANSPITDITGSIVSYSFHDGVVTLDQNNSQLCAFNVGTDGAGKPNSGRTTINAVPGGVGANAMDLGFGQNPIDPMNPSVAFTSVGTFDENNPVCTMNAYNVGSNYAESRHGLVVIGDAAPIPALDNLGLLLLIITLTGFGMIAMSRQRVVSRH